MEILAFEINLAKMNINHHFKYLYVNFIKKCWIYQVNVNILRLQNEHKVRQKK